MSDYVLVHPEPTVGGLARFRDKLGGMTSDLRIAWLVTAHEASQLAGIYRPVHLGVARGLSILGAVSFQRLQADGALP